ncbi:hypothetical protein [Spirosoma montaniterrae]|uniref:Uncharacterized protein n=1 Tax=Spirosoma montaniterrae TaxID=1178516 RepID=A0A1P9WYS6_9BACT|nr:hypothetical protein [Spirosoma montaniterrae]AQG80536.1 hypothetical protein AWR27_15120 [Spirosoma montaniterrae]
MNGETAAVTALREGIISLLESPAVQAISFQMGGVAVDGDSFQQVALRMRFWQHVRQPGETRDRPGRYPIRIRINPHLDSRVLGAYNQHTNTLVFRNANALTTTDGRYTVIHECVHAASDALRLRHLAFWDEAAAYLAEHVYQFNVNLISITDASRPSVHIHRLASNIASSISSTGNTTVESGDAQRLFDEVARVYRPVTGTTRTSRYDYDGIEF